MSKGDGVYTLEELRREVEGDKTLPFRESNLVFGEGREDAEVLFIGEAPGYHENEKKRPFVGRAGQLLRECIRELGWQEDDVYITNVVKRRPPENRDPLPDEIAAYAPYLKRQIEIISPRVIVALGRFAMNYFLPRAKITRDQGKVFRINSERGGRCIVPMFHPAAALRSPQVKEAFCETFRKLPRMIQKCKELPPNASQKKLF